MTAILTPAASAEYYLGQMASWRRPEDHYNAGIEADGRWWNPDDLFGLGDGEAIDPYLFKRLHAGRSPDGAEPLTRNAGTETRVAGVDLMFSADKSVTALWAMTRDDTPLRTRIEACHDGAVRTALDMIVRRYCALTIVVARDGRRRLEPGPILGATFRHSINHENQPHLHTHCVIFNAVRTARDGRWRALNSLQLRTWNDAAAATYHNALAAAMQREPGVRVERRNRRAGFWRVAGIDQDLVQAWSRREPGIRRPTPERADRARTRRARGRNARRPRAAMDCPGLPYHFANWFDEASAIGDVPHCIAAVTGHAAATEDDRRRRVLCDEVFARLRQDKSLFLLSTVVERTAHWLAGAAGPDIALREAHRMAARPDIVALPAPPDALSGYCNQRYQVRAADRDIRTIAALASTLAERSGHAIASGRIGAAIAAIEDGGRPLAPAQRRAVRRLASSPGGVTMLDARPNPMQDATVAIVAELYRQASYHVLTASDEYRRAARAAAAYGVEATSMSWIFRTADQRPERFGDRTLIVASEAENLSPPRLCLLLQFAERTGAALLFVNGAENAGAMDPLRQALLPASAVAAIAVSDSPSVRDSALPQQSVHLPAAAAGDAGAHRLHASETVGAAKKALVEDWTGFVRGSPDRTALVLASTRHAVRSLSSMMRSRVLAAIGASTPHPIAVMRGHGRSRRKETLSVAVGDHLRIGARNRGHGLFAGDIVRVQALSLSFGAVAGHATPVQRLRISGTDGFGRTLTFHADEICNWQDGVRLSHGYASSADAGMGLTVGRTFLLVDGHLPPGAAAQWRNGAADLYFSIHDKAVVMAGLRQDGVTQPANEDVRRESPGRMSPTAERNHIAALPALDLSGAGMRIPEQVARELAGRDHASAQAWRHAVALHDRRIGQLEKQAFRDGSYVELDRDPAYRQFDRRRQAQAAQGREQPSQNVRRGRRTGL